jgi:hypothetical protein
MIQVVDDARYPSRLSGTGTIPPDSELKPKDLCGMPWRLALALHADGWWLRSEIIWAKPNPMPESVTDRPTKSHEQVFLFAKSQRYYYDAGAVRLPLVSDGTGRFSNKRNCQYATHNGPNGQPLSSMIDAKVNPMGRNMPSVWSIPTEAYTGSHFATFPRKLVEPCIRAGTSEHGVCPQCGTPWQRLVDRHVHITGHTVKAHIAGGDLTAGHGWQGVPYADVTRRTIGWRPACPHPGHPIPAVVLDPFAGSGTVLVVAEALGRHAIGCDLSRPYLDMARRRIDRPHAKPIRPECTEHHPLFDREPPPALPGD